MLTDFNLSWKKRLGYTVQQIYKEGNHGKFEKDLW